MMYGFGSGRLLAAAILFLVVAAGLTVREFVHLAGWPEVETTVLATRLQEERSGGNDSHPLYRPEVSVRYVADGKTYQGRAVATYWSSDRHDAEQTLAEFTPGARRPMRYDPSNPADLRFDAAPSLEAFKIPLLSAAGGVVCLILWLVVRRT